MVYEKKIQSVLNRLSFRGPSFGNLTEDPFFWSYLKTKRAFPGGAHYHFWTDGEGKCGKCFIEYKMVREEVVNVFPGTVVFLHTHTLVPYSPFIPLPPP